MINNYQKILKKFSTLILSPVLLIHISCSQASVTPDATKTEIILQSEEIKLSIGDEYQIYIPKKSGSIVFQSPDSNIATVNAEGKIKAIKEGVVHIEVIYGGTLEKIKVTVSNKLITTDTNPLSKDDTENKKQCVSCGNIIFINKDQDCPKPVYCPEERVGSDYTSSIQTPFPSSIDYYPTSMPTSIPSLIETPLPTLIETPIPTPTSIIPIPTPTAIPTPTPLPTPTISSGLVFISGGTFTMGDIIGDGDINEKPHEEKVLSFYMFENEVTVGEYRRFAVETNLNSKGCDYFDGTTWLHNENNNYNQVGFNQNDNHPAVCMSLKDAKLFCNWKSQKDGLTVAYDKAGKLIDKNRIETTDLSQIEGYRIPSEAEWEYVASNKGVNKYSWGNGDPIGNIGASETGWSKPYADNFTYTSPVASFQKSVLGIYDLTGNVSEWTNDSFIKGGAWVDKHPISLRNSRRIEIINPSFSLGFRLVRSNLKNN